MKHEVRVCSRNPCGLFLMALNVLISFLNLRPLVCHSVLGFSTCSFGRCVFANQSRVSFRGGAGAKTESQTEKILDKTGRQSM